MAVVGYIDGYVDENNREYGLTDTVAQGSITAIKDGSSIDSFGDVEDALALKAGTTNLDNRDFACLLADDDLSRVSIIKDSEPTEGSERSIKSGAVYTALQNKASKDNVIANTQLIADTVGWSGKNKLPNTASSSGIFTVNADKTITANGTPQSDVYIRPYIYEAGSLESGNYILSGCPDGGSASKYEIQLYDTTAGTVAAHNYGGDTPVTVDDTHRYGVLVYVRTGTVASNLLFKPMLRDASILDPTYEPYRGTTAFPRDEQAVLGAKNLLLYPYNGGKNENGVTFTNNGDGTITVNGTASSYSDYSFHNRTADPLNLPAGKYYISGGISSAINIVVGRTYNGSFQELAVSTGNDAEFIVTAGDNLGITLRVNQGAVASNITVKPMIRLASDPDDTYVPYAMTNRELTDAVTNVHPFTPSNASITDFNGYYTINGKILTFVASYTKKGSSFTIGNIPNVELASGLGDSTSDAFVVGKGASGKDIIFFNQNGNLIFQEKETTDQTDKSYVHATLLLK